MPFKDYRVTSPFGFRQDPFNVSQKQFHTGIDLVKGHKDPIYAFTDGIVIFSGMGQSGSGFGGFGRVVAVEDRKGCLQVYAHLDTEVVKKGQKVIKGQMIGRQGNTGHSTGSHLHYEVRKKSQSTIPFGWIQDRKNNCYEPVKYLKDFYEEEKKQYVNLLPHMEERNHYPVDKPPIKKLYAHDIPLKPQKYGGLSYEILKKGKEPNTYIIKTGQFGMRKIFAPRDKDSSFTNYKVYK